jgi:hypothetical protein
MRYSALAFSVFLFWAGSATAQDQAVGPCRPNQIRADYRANATTGSLSVAVTLTNISDVTCVLSGSPRVVAADSMGNAVPTEVRWPIDGTDLEKGLESISLSSQGQAMFVIRTTDRTGLPQSTLCAGTLRIFLPGGTGAAGGRPVISIPAESCREIEVSGYRILN